MSDSAEASHQPLPADNHTHSEWSWDGVAGSMEGSCARAVELGLPSIAFTEHMDRTEWLIGDTGGPRGRSGPLAERIASLIGPDGRFHPPRLDVEGYRACLERCRARFPDLRILSGVELGEPHWYTEESTALLATGAYERVLGSVHSLEVDGERCEAGSLYATMPRADVVRTYLAEVLRLIDGSDLFAILAHADYPARRWPTEAGPFDPAAFEDEYRAVLRALASSGRALEVNTRLVFPPLLVRWWHEVGGDAVSFGSDAHAPARVAADFAAAVAMVEAHGFRPGRTPLDFWTRGLTR